MGRGCEELQILQSKIQSKLEKIKEFVSRTQGNLQIAQDRYTLRHLEIKQDEAPCLGALSVGLKDPR